MRFPKVFALAGLSVGLMISGPAHANLIINGGFESPVGPGLTGQGFLPNPWVTIPVGADTYSNDASYGLSPSSFGNFAGVTAFQGNRFAAGWSLVPEIFGESLGGPLTAGTSYILSGALHQALRSDLDHPGGYDVYAATGLGDTAPLFLVNTGSTIDDAAWETFSVNFIAPFGVGTRSFLMFSPEANNANLPAYPGIDALDLSPSTVTTVPEPITLSLFGTGLAGAVTLRRRKKKAA